MTLFWGRVFATNPDGPDHFAIPESREPLRPIEADGSADAAKMIAGEWDHGEFEVMRGEISIEILIYPDGACNAVEIFWVHGLNHPPYYAISKR